MAKMVNLCRGQWLLLCLLAVPLWAQPKALVLFSSGYGANAHLLMDRLIQQGFQLTTTGITRQVAPCQSYAGPLGCQAIDVDSLVSEICCPAHYDLLLIISATKWSGVAPLNATLQSDAAVNLVKNCHDGGTIIASWCSGVRLMARANIIEGCRVTGNDQYAQEYRTAGADYVGPNIYPLTDGQIITWGRGQFYYEAAIDAMEDACLQRSRQ